MMETPKGIKKFIECYSHSIHHQGRESMFFQETKNPFLTDIALPAVFFDQILPVINPFYTKVYLYAYYLSASATPEQDMDNQILATKLKVELDEVLEAWDFLESCDLIRKHHTEDGLAWDYSIEFLDLKSLYLHKTGSASTVSTDEMVVLAKNTYLRAMFDSIEAITKKTLNYNDIRSINEFMKEYSVAKELVIEAFSFSVSIKKSKTVASALGILRTWYLDGIRTAEDLQLHLQNKHQRYGEYRKILSFLGEYRLPTGPEKKMIDNWLDTMGFGMEVIESAVEKSVSIKNPNMNYINGVLKNWHKKYSALPHKRNYVKPNKLSELEFRNRILEKLDITNPVISREEDRYLSDLYHNFAYNEIEIAIKYLRSKQKDSAEEPVGGNYALIGVTPEAITIEGLTRFLIQPISGKKASPLPTLDSDKIEMEDIRDIINEKAPTKKTAEKKSTEKSSLRQKEAEELEQRLIAKRETINKKGEQQDHEN